jgi:ferrochelatase
MLAFADYMDGFVLLNLGTPDSHQVSDVRKYLAEFLMDPLVIDIPFVARLALIYGIILPFRPKKSAAAYQKIWTERGSPLLFHLVDLGEKVKKNLNSDFQVEIAMRYGKPTLETAMKKLQTAGVKKIKVLPLYPQYSLAATESSIVKAKEIAKNLGVLDRLEILPAFYKDGRFVDSFSEIAENSLREFKYDYILFSFHGLPERHIKKTEHGDKSHCLATENCCETITNENRDCYRAQSFASAHAIAQKLGLTKSDYGKKYSVSFQSRLGRTPWIRPYTDLVFGDLVKQGVKRLAVVCPSFVADCLETVEEIEIRGKESFISFGGEALKLVPSLNSSESWVKAVSEFARNPETMNK